MGFKKEDLKFFSFRVFFVFLWDIFFLALLSIGFITIANKTAKFAQGYMGKVNFSELLSSNQEIINSNYAALKMVLFWMIFWLVSFFILYLLMVSLFKGVLWLKLNKKKISRKILFKYFLMNVIYLIPIIALSLWMYFQDMFNYLFFVLFIFFYFYTVSCYYLSKKEEVFKTIKLTFTKGFNPSLILRYLLIFILFFVLNYIFSKQYFSFKIIFNVFFYTIYLSIFKVYMNDVFGKVLK
jgi:hypothetical protein